MDYFDDFFRACVFTVIALVAVVCSGLINGWNSDCTLFTYGMLASGAIFTTINYILWKRNEL